jgi:hypothetical protein
MTDHLDKFTPLEGRRRRDPITLAEFTEWFAPTNRRPGDRDMYVVGFEAVRDTFQPGDELWVVVSERESWAHRRGTASVDHVRSGKVIGGVVLRIS